MKMSFQTPAIEDHEPTEVIQDIPILLFFPPHQSSAWRSQSGAKLSPMTLVYLKS